MKKFFWMVAAATALFASCAKDATTDVLPAPEATDDFTATFDMSRAELDGTVVKWNDGDLITIFTKTNHNRQYEAHSLTEDDRSAKFSYTNVFTPATEVTTITTNYAVYPYDAEATISGDVITTKINAEQAYNADKVDLSNSLMVAKSSDLTLSFVNAGALLRFKVAKEHLPDVYELKSIKVVSASNLAGKVTIDTANSSKAEVVADGASKSVELTGINVEIEETAEMFYLALPATNFAEGDKLYFTFVVNGDEETLWEKEITLPAFELKQNAIKTISYTIKAEDEFTGLTPETDSIGSFEELLAALAEGKTEIKLSDSFVFSEPLVIEPVATTRANGSEGITIDLNGFTISYESTVAGESMILNKGNLTLKNGVVTFKYTGTPDSSYGKGNYTISNNGNLTLDQVTIENLSGTISHASYAIDNNSINQPAELTINSGKVYNNGSHALRMIGGNGKNTVTINDGEVEGYTRAIWIHLPGSDATKAPEVELNVNGGTLTGANVDSSDNKLAIYSYSYGNDMKNVVINLSNGTFNGDVALTGGTNKTNIETLNITGGVFNGRWGDAYSYGDDAKAAEAITITGGEFSDLTPLTYLNGAGEKVTLAKDVAIETDKIYMQFNGEGTLDLNGQTVRGTTTGSGVNQVLFDVRGKLTVKNGFMTTEHTGTNMGWNNCSEIFYVGANGTLNLEDVTLENQGGSDMAYVVDLGNASTPDGVTLNINNSELNSTYTAVRVFNNGDGMNHVKINNSKISSNGAKALWVHIYTSEDNGGKGVKDYTLDLDIFGNGNTYTSANPNRVIEFGFSDDYLNFDGDGNLIITTAEQLKSGLAAGGNLVLGDNIAMNERLALKNNPAFCLDGKGFTISQAEDFANEYALFDDITETTATFKNIIFDGLRGGAAIRSIGGENEVNIDNVTIQNCKHTQVQGLLRLCGKNTITNSKFIGNECSMVISLNYDGNNDDPQVVENCLFQENTCSSVAVLYYVKGAMATINGNKFIKNKVNLTSNGATVYMGFTENNVVTNNLFEENIVTTTDTTKRISGGIMLGYKTKFTGNAFIGNTVSGPNAKGNDVCASVYYSDIDLSGNYWGGNAPVENDDYSVEFDTHKVIINDYLTENPFK